MSAYSSLPSRLLQIDAQRIAVRDNEGRGPAVVLVHGNSASSRAWQRQFEGALGTRCRLVALDLPGHGDSPAPDEAQRGSTYSLPSYGAIIEGVARHLGLERPVFVGWSLGGHAVLEAVPQLPEAAGFLIFGTPPLPYPPAADFGGAFLKIGLGFQKTWTDEEAREYVGDFVAPEAEVPSFLLNDALRTDGNAREMAAVSIGTVGYRDEIALARAMHRPLAILHGVHDALVNRAYLEQMAPTLPTLWEHRVHLVDGAGHAPQWEQPERFDALLGAFVEHCT